MTPVKTRLFAAALLAIVPAVAQAEGFYTFDLGDGGTPDACMFRAQRSLNAMVVNSGNADAFIASGAWSVDAYHLQPGDVAVQFLCPMRDSYVSVALVVAHSMGPESERISVVNDLVERWNATGQAGEVRDQGQPSK